MAERQAVTYPLPCQLHDRDEAFEEAGLVSVLVGEDAVRNLGAVLCSYRETRRMGTRELAKLLGVSAATLNRIERGENCDAQTLAKILLWLLGKTP